MSQDNEELTTAQTIETVAVIGTLCIVFPPLAPVFALHGLIHGIGGWIDDRHKRKEEERKKRLEEKANEEAGRKYYQEIYDQREHELAVIRERGRVEQQRLQHEIAVIREKAQAQIALIPPKPVPVPRAAMAAIAIRECQEDLAIANQFADPVSRRFIMARINAKLLRRIAQLIG